MSSAALAIAAPPLTPGQRQFARARLNLPAKLITFNGSLPCTLLDLSQSGAKLNARERPRVGSMVVVEGLPIELFGTVRWSGFEQFGIELEQSLPLDRVVALRRYADTAPSREQRVAVFARNWVLGLV